MVDRTFPPLVIVKLEFMFITQYGKFTTRIIAGNGTVTHGIDHWR